LLLGGRTPRWDWQFQNTFTGEITIVENKFGTAGLTSAQRVGAQYLTNLTVEQSTYEFWAYVGATGGYDIGMSVCEGIR